jgi:uncharacterized protein with HEPN domain
MAGMRNAIVHGYFSLDWTALWATVKEDVPVVREQILLILESL